jgi:NADH-quinone oxidoreductase subunit E
VEELEQHLEKILTRNRKHRRHLISLLQEVQHVLGYLSNEAMMKIADFLDIPASAVYGVATFYNQFRFTPLGKHPVNVCMGTACHMAGGQLVLDAMARELDIEVGAITEDHKFNLERVACVGCCALAPVVVIGDDVYSRMTAQKVGEVLVTIEPVVQEQQTNSEGS